MRALATTTSVVLAARPDHGDADWPPRLDHALEARLAQQVLDILDAGEPQMEPATFTAPVDTYTSDATAAAEAAALFTGAYPLAVAHCSSLPHAGSYITHDVGGLPLILSRCRSGSGRVRAYLNVCRHRGTRLVGADKPSGRRSGRWVCPYHGWQYRADTGRLVRVPDEVGFPHVTADTDAFSLVRVPCVERYGFVWVIPGSLNGDGAAEQAANDDYRDDGVAAVVDAHLGEDLVADFTALRLDEHVVYDDDGSMRAARGVEPHTGPHTLVPSQARGFVPLPASGARGEHCASRPLNWKLAFDVFLESYHLKYAHTNTIYPIFFDNVGVFEQLSGLHVPLGAVDAAAAAASGTVGTPVSHMRNLFPKRSIAEAPIESDGWRLRAVSNVLYYVFPNTLLLVQPDHISVNHVYPRGVGACAVTHQTLIDPRDAAAEATGDLPAAGKAEGRGEGNDTDSSVGRQLKAKRRRYWDKNIEIFLDATMEDFDMGDSIQLGLLSGAHRSSGGLTFGRYEQSLAWFHAAVERAVAAAAGTTSE